GSARGHTVGLSMLLRTYVPSWRRIRQARQTSIVPGRSGARAAASAVIARERALPLGEAERVAPAADLAGQAPGRATVRLGRRVLACRSPSRALLGSNCDARRGSRDGRRVNPVGATRTARGRALLTPYKNQMFPGVRFGRWSRKLVSPSRSSCS